MRHRFASGSRTNGRAHGAIRASTARTHRRSAIGPGRHERPRAVRILVLNPGSATLKTTVLDLPDTEPRFTRTVDWDESDADGPAGAVATALAEVVGAGIATDTIERVGY